MSGTPPEDALPTISSTPTVVVLPNQSIQLMSPPTPSGGKMNLSVAYWSGPTPNFIVPFTLGDHEQDVVSATHHATSGGSSNPQEVTEDPATGGGSSNLLLDTEPTPSMTIAASVSYRQGMLLLRLSSFEWAVQVFEYAARRGHEGAREELATLHSRGY